MVEKDGMSPGKGRPVDGLVQGVGLFQRHDERLLIRQSHVIVKSPEPRLDEPNIEFIDSQVFVIMGLAAGARETGAQRGEKVGPDALLLVRAIQAGPHDGLGPPRSHGEIVEDEPEGGAPLEKAGSFVH